jgi:hypothetical protein
VAKQKKEMDAERKMKLFFPENKFHSKVHLKKMTSVDI